MTFLSIHWKIKNSNSIVSTSFYMKLNCLNNIWKVEWIAIESWFGGIIFWEWPRWHPYGISNDLNVSCPYCWLAKQKSIRILLAWHCFGAVHIVHGAVHMVHMFDGKGVCNAYLMNNARWSNANVCEKSLSVSLLIVNIPLHRFQYFVHSLLKSTPPTPVALYSVQDVMIQ